mmetsp:Transcript_6341/g.14599  ORF Transcript_6341/g.14599 Transcript_6341/m.14599 type:complete len:202 (+) Transcript_6341:554-1159(+)
MGWLGGWSRVGIVDGFGRRTGEEERVEQRPAHAPPRPAPPYLPTRLHRPRPLRTPPRWHPIARSPFAKWGGRGRPIEQLGPPPDPPLGRPARPAHFRGRGVRGGAQGPGRKGQAGQLRWGLGAAWGDGQQRIQQRADAEPRRVPQRVAQHFLRRQRLDQQRRPDGRQRGLGRRLLQQRGLWGGARVGVQRQPGGRRANVCV